LKQEKKVHLKTFKIMRSFGARSSKLRWHHHKWRNSATYNDVSGVGVANHNQRVSSTAI